MGKERKKTSIAGSESKFPWDKKERKSQSSEDATSDHSSTVNSSTSVEPIQTCLPNNSINPLMNYQTCSQERQEQQTIGTGHVQAMITEQPQRSLQQELDFVLLLLKIQFAIIQSYQESQ